MTLGFRGEGFYQPGNHERSDHGHQNDADPPWVFGRMNIGIIKELKLSQEQNVVNETDEHSESPCAQPGDNAH